MHVSIRTRTITAMLMLSWVGTSLVRAQSLATSSPFDDVVGRSIVAFFDVNNPVTLSGTIVKEPTPIKQGASRYFMLAVKESSGVISNWNLLYRGAASEVIELKLGKTVKVNGYPMKDDSHRFEVNRSVQIIIIDK